MNGEGFRPPHPPFPEQPFPGQGSGAVVQFPQGPGSIPRPPQQAMPRIDSYYSSVAMVATSPREISVLFGSYVPAVSQTGEHGAVPVYEKQILMTVEQVEDLVRTLNQAVKDFKTRREQLEAQISQTQGTPT